MVEKNNLVSDSSKEDYVFDEIYLHSKNRHFKQNSFIGYSISEIDKKKK